MLSLSAVLASLPPIALLESDLARFCAQTLARRSRAELSGLASLFGEEELRGYPPKLGALLAALCETLVAQGVEPHGLDARTCDVVLGSRAFLARLELRVEVRRTRLRPGTFLNAELRQALGMRLIVLPGRGRELMLVGPIDVAQVPEARFSVPLGVAMARPGDAGEAETLRMSWARIEEAVGLDGPLATQWEARFCQISRRENHDAEGARVGLSGLTLDLRRRLWDALIQHLRDQELAEQHRPQRRGLERRLAALGLDADLPWLEAVIGLAESAYRAAGLDGEVMAGRCPCPEDDLERWCQWVEVPAASRQRLKDMAPPIIELLLVRLAEEEAGRAEGLVDDDLRRPLANLRDGCLRPRWQRARTALAGVDPLALAESQIASGDDLGTMKLKLEALATESRDVVRPAPAERPRPASEPRDVIRAAAPADRLRPASEPRAPTTPPPTEPPASAEPAAPAEDRPIAASHPAETTRTGRPRTGTVAPARFDLPPMPDIPPPRPPPRVRPRTELPPMPTAPPPRTHPPRPERPPTQPATPSTRAQFQPRAPAPLPPRSPGPASHVAPRPVSGPPSQVAPRPPSRTATVPHLVTPAQGNEFYDASFRELELLERDILQRGVVPGAADRVDAIARDAQELHAALGPSARSGDRDFLAAQRRIDKVLEYIERIRPLLSNPPAPEGGSGERGLLGRLFGRRR